MAKPTQAIVVVAASTEEVISPVPYPDPVLTVTNNCPCCHDIFSCARLLVPRRLKLRLFARHSPRRWPSSKDPRGRARCDRALVALPRRLACRDLPLTLSPENGVLRRAPEDKLVRSCRTRTVFLISRLSLNLLLFTLVACCSYCLASLHLSQPSPLLLPEDICRGEGCPAPAHQQTHAEPLDGPDHVRLPHEPRPGPVPVRPLRRRGRRHRQVMMHPTRSRKRKEW